MGSAMSSASFDMPRLLSAAVLAAALAFVAALPASATAATCDGRKATIVGTAGNDVIVGKKASDVIYGGGGDDRISGGPNGNDRICGGAGEDRIHGGRGFDSLHGDGGDDWLFGDSGSDRAEGGDGNDALNGAEGSDRLLGGPGDDEIRGVKGPDLMIGGAGGDVLIGDKGSDEATGAGGQDWLYGDKGNDRLDGGPGEDRVDGGAGDDPTLEGGSGTDTVLAGTGIDDADGGEGDGDIVRGDSGIDDLDGGGGAQDIVSYASATRGGVVVSLSAGKAKGDGHDTLQGFEDVVGSPQGDEIVGDSGGNRLDGGVGDDALDGAAGDDVAFGGAGTDDCAAFSVEHSCGVEENPPGDGTFVILNQGLDGASLIVQGGPSNDGIHIAYGNGAWAVSDGSGIFAGDGCSQAGVAGAACPAATPTGLLVVTGGAGDDSIQIDGGVPAGVKVRANGNAGSDSLGGGPGDDVLEAGENYNGPDNGNDSLAGNAGSDVLYADPGNDQLFGGPGNDLLVSSVAVCQGHSYDGGPGNDTVSYGRSDADMRVELGGTGAPGGCGRADRVGADNESLEGSKGPDVLVGDNRENSFFGHTGADVFLGRGGSDFIDAADGQRDKMIHCGGGGDDDASVDRADPRPVGC
jgi:Ca2+-binding RTX toxin-like protein